MLIGHSIMLLRCLFSLILVISVIPSYAVEADEFAPIVDLPQLKGDKAGSKTNLLEHKGKLIYLDFWASWCGPCRQSFPFLQEIRNKYADQGFEVVAVNVDTNLAPALRFLEKFPVNYPILLDHSAEKAQAYSVQGLPTAYLINQRGQIIYKHLGFKEKDKQWIIALIEQNLPK